MPRTATRRIKDDELSPRVIWGGGLALAVVVPLLFWLVWKSQFAAAPGYLFGTPTLPVEAGYCLAVTHHISPMGVPRGSYFDQAADFWIQRMIGLKSDMAGAIAAGEARLSRDMNAAPTRNGWLQYAMDQCSYRAVNYGARFRVFD